MPTLLFLCLINWFDWKTLTTEHFTIMYKPDHHREALQTLEMLEYYRDNVVELTGNDTRKVPVVIEDIGTISNGFADPLFYNTHIYTYPPGHGYYLESSENWYRTVSVHEYAHIAHMTRTAGSARFLTGVFGALFQPNIYSPGWLIEGITVYAESDLSPHEGRLNDAFFDNYIGACAAADDLPGIIEATNTPLRYPRSAFYLYGGEFTQYLTERYGRESLRDFYRTYGSCFWAPLSAVFPFIGIDCAARRSFGKTLPALFHEWHDYEETRFHDWHLEGTQITNGGWYKHSLVCDSTYLYYVAFFQVKTDAFRYRTFYQIIKHDLNSHAETTIISLTTPVTSPLRIHEHTLYYTTLELEPGYANVTYTGFGGTMKLHAHDLRTDKDIILFSGNLRTFCVLPDTSILYAIDRSHSHGSEVWLYRDGEHELLGNTRMLVQELTADSDHILAAAGHDFENPDIYSMDLTPLSFLPVFRTPGCEGHLSFTAEDKVLITNSITGIQTLYELDLQNKSLYQLTRHGYASAGLLSRKDSMLYYIGLNREGLDLYYQRYQPVPCTLSSWPTAIKPLMTMDPTSYQHGSYVDVLQTLMPAVRLPYIMPANDEWNAWVLGGLLLGGDATNENFYSAIIAYDQMNEEPYGYLFWRSLFFTPLAMSFTYQYHDEIICDIVYPLYARLSPGLTNVTMFLNIHSQDRFTRKSVAPGISLRFTFPLTTYTASCAFPFERHAWSSSVTRNGQICNVGISRYIAGGELKLRGAGYLDLHNPDTLSMKIRGYDAITSPKGILLKTEYSHVLVRIRQGTWNPNIYIEDIIGALFYEHILDHFGESSFAFGCLIKFEIKTGFGFLQLVPQAGIAMTRERTVKAFLEIIPATRNPYF